MIAYITPLTPVILAGGWGQLQNLCTVLTLETFDTTLKKTVYSLTFKRTIASNKNINELNSCVLNHLIVHIV